MTSQALIKSVARKLKYYIDVQRKEECFDLDLNDRDKQKKKNVSTASFWSTMESEAFRKNKFALPTKPERLFAETDYLDYDREQEIRADLQHYMATISYEPKKLPKREHPFLGPVPRPAAKQSKKSARSASCISLSGKNKRDKIHSSLHSASWAAENSVTYQPPPWKIPNEEYNRLVTMATKLILLLEKQKEEAREKAKETTFRKAKRSTASIETKVGKTRSKTSTVRSLHFPVGHSHHQNVYDGLYSARGSSGMLAISSPPGSSMPSSLPEWLRQQILKVDVSEDEVLLNNMRSHDQPTRLIPRPATPGMLKRQVDAARQTEKWVYTGTMEDISIQTDPLEVPILYEGTKATYKIRVTTGRKIGAGTRTDVHIFLYGQTGRSEKIVLTNSLRDNDRKKRRKFSKGQTDTFTINGFHLGPLTLIRIGHDSPELRHAWFLEKVIVVDASEQRQYEFACKQWLSAVDGDKKTVRDLRVIMDLAIPNSYPEQNESDEDEIVCENDMNERQQNDADAVDRADITSLTPEMDNMSLVSSNSLLVSEDLNLSRRQSGELSRSSGKASCISMEKLNPASRAGSDDTDVEVETCETHNVVRSGSSDSDSSTEDTVIRKSTSPRASYDEGMRNTLSADLDMKVNSAASLSKKMDTGQKKRTNKVSFDDKTNAPETGSFGFLQQMLESPVHAKKTGESANKTKKISFKGGENATVLASPAADDDNFTPAQLEEILNFFDDPDEPVSTNKFGNNSNRKAVSSMDSMIAEYGDNGKDEGK